MSPLATPFCGVLPRQISPAKNATRKLATATSVPATWTTS